MYLNKGEGESVTVEIEGHPKLEGLIGRRGDEMALKIMLHNS